MTITTNSPRGAKVSEQVARAIVADIRALQLPPGSRLESELALLSRYNASRESVREALRLLEFQGMVEVRRGPGGGAFVANNGGLAKSASLHFHMSGSTYRDLCEALSLAFQTVSRELASRGVDASGLSARRTAPTSPNLTDQVLAEFDFLRALLDRLGNELICVAVRAVMDIALPVLVATIEPTVDISGAEKERSAIIAAIVAADAGAAAAATRRYFGGLEYLLARQGSLDAPIEWI